MRRKLQRPIVFACVLGMLAVGDLAAQSTGFIPPGTSGFALTLPDKSTFDERVDEAPWRLGVFRITPWFGIRDGANVLGETLENGRDNAQDDYTVTAGAGVRGYVRFGPQVIWATHVLPEYTWWADDQDRSRLNGRYGTGLFAYLNRAQFELSQRWTEQQQFFSPEIQRLTSNRTVATRLQSNFRLGARFWIALGGERTESTNQEDNSVIFRQLDREEVSLRAFVEYRAPGGLRLRAGYEEVAAEFERDARLLSNTSTGPVFGIAFAGNRFAADGEISRRTLEPDLGSQLTQSEETLGLLQTVWELSERSSLLVFGRRSLSYALDLSSSYLINERLGVQWRGSIRDRYSLALFGETGEDRYQSLTSDVVIRTDDVTSYGARIGMNLGRNLRLDLEVRTLGYQTPGGEFDRDVTTYGFRLDFLPLERLTRRVFDRLRVGDPTGDW